MAEPMARRVYVLSDVLVDGIKQFAEARGVSEVAAVRLLLREALDRRESGPALETRARLMIASLSLDEMWRTLVVHPQVKALTRMSCSSLVECLDGHSFMIAGVRP